MQSLSVNTPPPPGIYDCGRQVVQQEGVRSLWKGLTPFATHLTLKYALRMGSNSVYQVREGVRGRGGGGWGGDGRLLAGQPVPDNSIPAFHSSLHCAWAQTQSTR